MTWQNKALDAEPPIASFMKSMLIGGGPVNAGVPHCRLKWSAVLREVLESVLGFQPPSLRPAQSDGCVQYKSGCRKSIKRLQSFIANR
jgi:hypothetical protein